MSRDSVEFLLPYFPKAFRARLQKLVEQSDLEEIHVRVHQPIQVVFSSGDRLIGPDMGEEVPSPADLKELTTRLCRQSVYAHMEELSQGYISLPGGYRAGVSGRCVPVADQTSKITDVTSVNIRIPGCHAGDTGRLFHLLCKDGHLCSTMILSPPGCGKTTFLRELIRIVSTGTPSFQGQRVAVADTRYELAGVSDGVPAFDLGPRTDIRSGGDRAEALLALLCTMSPQVLATDEISRSDEAEVAISAGNAGVALLSTAHADRLETLARRPGLSRLLEENLFERFVILSRRKGPGTVEGVLDETKQNLLMQEAANA